MVLKRCPQWLKALSVLLRDINSILSAHTVPPHTHRDVCVYKREKKVLTVVGLLMKFYSTYLCLLSLPILHSLTCTSTIYSLHPSCSLIPISLFHFPIVKVVTVCTIHIEVQIKPNFCMERKVRPEVLLLTKDMLIIYRI